MNQRLLLTAVAVISTVIGTPSISRAETVNEASITSEISSEKEMVAQQSNLDIQLAQNQKLEV